MKKDWTPEIRKLLSREEHLKRTLTWMKSIEDDLPVEEWSHEQQMDLLFLMAKDAAKAGDTEPLRQFIMQENRRDLSGFKIKYINPGRRKGSLMDAPARDVRIVRAHFKGKRLRPKPKEIVEIVAALHGVPVEALEAHLH